MRKRLVEAEERIKMAKWVLKNDGNYNAAAEEFDIMPQTVRRWTKVYQEEGPEGLQFSPRFVNTLSGARKSPLDDF